jgi:hypothetical protein
VRYAAAPSSRLPFHSFAISKHPLLPRGKLRRAFRAPHFATIVSDDQLPSELLLEQDRGRTDKLQTFNDAKIASAMSLGMRMDEASTEDALDFGSGRIRPGK